MSYVIGVDSSTTATKAVVWSREGRAVADGRAEFSLALPRPGWHEQDSEDWWRSTVTAVRRALQSVDASDVEAIAVTHQRETFVCLDEDGRAVRPAIVWMDVRATRQVEQFGSDDVQSAGVGANATRLGTAYMNVGTAVVAGTVSERYAWDRAFRTLFGAVPGTYMMETLLQGGTYTVNWFLERIAALDAQRLGLGLRDVDVLEAAAARVGPGAEGLLLVPYWASAQTPYWDPAARGILFGLAGHHGKEHLFRALMEGIAFEQRLALEGMERGLGRPLETLLTTGGGSRSALWRQILADVTRKTVVACREAETTGLGAGIHAAAAVGWHGSLVAAAEAMTGTGARHTPDERTAARYDELFAIYREIYPRTAPLHKALQRAFDDQPAT